MKFFSNKREQQRYSAETGHSTRELKPLIDRGAATEYISLPAGDIPELAARYATAVETEQTSDWCRCEWIIHPDDVKVERLHCRLCDEPKNHILHKGLPEDKQYTQSHDFKGVRMRRGDQAPDCPVHTKEGFLIYFFEWVFRASD
jgi:hypothetical protein